MTFHFKNLTSEKVSKTIFLKTLKAVAKYEPGLGDFEISLVLVDNKKIRSLNCKYRGVDKTTDVLAFKLSSTLAEIFISVLKAREQAKKRGYTQKRELATLFIHGLLHISGYEDNTAKERKKMFKMQDRILDEL